MRLFGFRFTAILIWLSGWRVDFNLNLQSFEADVRGVRHLIDLALSSPQSLPPRLLFTSSIATLRRKLNYFAVISQSLATYISTESPTNQIISETPTPAETATGQGYGESKWVAARLLELASSETALCPITVRVGQVSGGVNGCWNPLEWMPSIVQSSTLIKCLPALDGKVRMKVFTLYRG